jgi:hypothetical protein
MLYEMLTGNVPFADQTFMGVLAQHVRQPPLDPRQAAPDRPIPDSVARLAMTLLAKTPEGRPADAEAVAVEIDRILAEDRGIDAVETGPREQANADAETQHLDELAHRPTTAPDTVDAPSPAAWSSQMEAALSAASDAALSREGVRPPVAPTRALGSGGMGDTSRSGVRAGGVPAPRRSSSAWLVFAVIVGLGVGGVAAWMASGGIATDDAIAAPASPTPSRVDAPASAAVDARAPSPVEEARAPAAIDAAPAAMPEERAAPAIEPASETPSVARPSAPSSERPAKRTKPPKKPATSAETTKPTAPPKDPPPSTPSDSTPPAPPLKD